MPGVAFERRGSHDPLRHRPRQKPRRVAGSVASRDEQTPGAAHDPPRCCLVDTGRLPHGRHSGLGIIGDRFAQPLGTGDVDTGRRPLRADGDRDSCRRDSGIGVVDDGERPGTSYTGVTDGSGIYAPTVDLGNTWAPGGSTTTVSAIAGSASASVGLTVLGANALGWGQSAPMSGTDAASSVPVQMSRVFPAPIVQSRAGGSFSTNWFHVTLLADGSVWTRGTNGRGQLGDGTTTDRALTFAKVPGVSDVVQVATGSGFVMALRSDGRVYVWGSNNRGQLGLGMRRTGCRRCCRG